jgi:splicing factor U2AF subunit
MWPNPMIGNTVPPADEKTLQAQYDEFYEDVFEELSNFGEVEELNVCENLGDHLVGNVYAKFHKEEEAQEALMKLQGRFYGGTLGF